MTILVIGGAASGKSAIAEKFCASLGGPLLYIATMLPTGDKETQLRIERHRALRKDKGFSTLECYTNLHHVILPHRYHVVLLECLGNLCANELFQEDTKTTWKQTAEAIASGIAALQRQSEHLVIVTNNIFDDGLTTYDEETANYIRALGQINRMAANKADVVVEAVCGIPVFCKGKAVLS